MIIVTKFRALHSPKQFNSFSEKFDFITQLKQEEECAFGKSLSKRFNNSVQGETLQNVRNCIGLQFISHTEIGRKNRRQSIVSYAAIKHWFSLSFYKFHKKKTIFDKPIESSFRILEIGKFMMH